MEVDPTKDFQLSEHFSFFELTCTSNAALQAGNRVDAVTYLPTLTALAGFLEKIRDGRPLAVNSAFRSATLNKATKGSSPTSQHPMGQACDFHRPGEDPQKSFVDTLAFLKAQALRFGQLIDESADRGYLNPDGSAAVVRWVHVSLGSSFWKPERCGEVLRKWDEKGQAKFLMLEKVPQPEDA